MLTTRSAWNGNTSNGRGKSISTRWPSQVVLVAKFVARGRFRDVGPPGAGEVSEPSGASPRRERHLRSKDLPAWPVLTLNPGSSVRVYPRGPGTRLRRTPSTRKSFVPTVAAPTSGTTRRYDPAPYNRASGVPSVASNHEDE